MKTTQSVKNGVPTETVGTKENGAYCDIDGDWITPPSKAIKEDFTILNTSEVLSKVCEMDIMGWSFIGSDGYRIGPFAEDFYRTFGTGSGEDIESDSTHISARDIASVGLVAIQELSRQIELLKEENAELRERLVVIESSRE